LGIDCPAQEYTGPPDELASFVVSLNLHRRHLTESQRAMVAAGLATGGHGGDRRTADQAANLPLGRPVTQAAAAGLLNVGERTVRAAAKVRRDGSPELVAEVQAGRKSVSAAARELATAGPPVERPMPAHLAGLFAETPLITAAVTALGALVRAETLPRRIDGFAGLVADADRLAGRLNQAKPGYVCGRCDGAGDEAGEVCPACDGRGWGVRVMEGRYDDPVRVPAAP
jgi:hypothetical protein